jgi:DNA-binding MarR family transcriptional regulator
MTTSRQKKIIDTFVNFIEFQVEDLIAFRPKITNFPEAHYRLMYNLFPNCILSMKELGDLMSVSKTYITKIVDALSDEGLVERHPDLNDRRMMNIQLTKSGVKKFKILQELVRAEALKRLEPFSPEDLDNFVNLLEELIKLQNKYPYLLRKVP